MYIRSSDFVRIDGRIWRVKVLDLKQSYERVDTENAGHTIAPGAPMELDPLGTFYPYNVTFGREGNMFDEYDELFMFLSFPHRVGFNVEIVHNQSMLAYKAYSGKGMRELGHITIDRVVYWKHFTANLIPIEAQVLPL